MYELKPNEYAKVRSLFQGIEHSISVKATIEGNIPGRIFADNASRPQVTIALTVEGYILAGNHDDDKTIRMLHKFFEEQILSGRVYVGDDDRMSLILYPPTWEAILPEIIPTHEADKLPIYLYQCSDVKLDWRSRIPEGYTVRQIDRGLLAIQL